jgi:hypothetical protein
MERERERERELARYIAGPSLLIVMQNMFGT